MSHRWFCVLLVGALASRFAVSQSFPPGLQNYFGLTDAQVQAIADLDKQFSTYDSKQQTIYYQLQSQANGELAKDSPDPAVVGDAYAQMEMLRRDYDDQLAQAQSKIGALLTADQAVLVAGLLDVVRLQPLVSEAQCVSLVQRQTPYLLVYASSSYSLLTSSCQPSVPTALTNYLQLTDDQIIAIQNANQGNQDYMSRQSLKILELQNEIKDVTAAQTIDSAKLGADYVAIAQIQRDESDHRIQLVNSAQHLDRPATRAIESPR
jgi:hypothetical protein